MSECPQYKNYKYSFVQNCCKNLPCAESFYALLTICRDDKLDELGSTLTRAKGILDSDQYERLHQLWQQRA